MGKQEGLQDPSGRPEVEAIVRRALEEDIQGGDASTLAVVDPAESGRALMISKGHYKLSGVGVAARVFTIHEPALACRPLAQDGSPIGTGQPVLEIVGPAGAILTAERTALNLIQRMTGIATAARAFVDRTAGHSAVILDTRKTTPGLRILEKYAVRCGGAHNHRMGLYDKIMLKDNHLALWRRHHEGSLADMIRTARTAYPDLEIEVEVESVEDLAAVLDANPDWVLLDNMQPDQLRACVELNAGRTKLEASGGITLDLVAAIAATGVDAVSVGALTHSVMAADLSLEIDLTPQPPNP